MNKKRQIEFIKDFVEKILLEKPKFYGSIKLNFQNGTLVNTNILETILYVANKHKIPCNY